MPNYTRLFDMLGKDAKDKAFVSAQVPFVVQVGTRQFMDCAFAMVVPAANINTPDPKLVVANAYRENFNGISGYDDHVAKQEVAAKVESGITSELAINFIMNEDKSDVVPQHDLLRDFARTSHEAFNIKIESLLASPNALPTDSFDSINPSNADNVVPFRRKRRKVSAPL